MNLTYPYVLGLECEPLCGEVGARGKTPGFPQQKELKAELHIHSLNLHVPG